MNALRAEDLHFAWPSRDPILRGIDLQMQAGEVVALLGRNGAGKSTLLSVLSGWLVPTRGRVWVGDTPLAGEDRRSVARQIAVLSADEEAHPPFRVAETVALGRHPWRGALAAPRPEDEAAVVRSLERMALVDFAERPVGALSSGERRRVALARVLAQDAPVLLLDEPTVHLDVGLRLGVLDALRDEAKHRGRAVLLVMHDLSLITRVADRVWVLDEGRIALDGAPAEVLEDKRLGDCLGARLGLVAHPNDGSPLPVALGPTPSPGDPEPAS